VLIDEKGQELLRADHDDQGGTLPPGMADRACLVGAFRLLEEIARKDDNSHYRQAARKQADALKKMLKRLARDRDADLTDAELFSGPLQKLIGGPRALPPPDDVLTINMK
jgi:hypothetical protein